MHNGLTDLMFGKGKWIYETYSEECIDVIDTYKARINSCQFRGINLKEAEIDEATEVFTRLNVGGKDLSLFEIMVAKTYDRDKDFDLYEKFQELKQDLEPSKYDTISSATVLQLLAILVERECQRKTILRIDKTAFIEAWDETISCLKSAIDFFRSYGIPVSRLLPYNALLVPFGYFFHHHKSNPTGLIKARLEDFFWKVSLGQRYSSSVESKFVQDIEKIDKIIESKLPKYEWSVDISPQSIINNGFFRTSSSFVKAILCLYTMQKPKSFDNDLGVNIDNSWLKIGTSKNYHHYFPKSYMKKNHTNVDYFQVNHILNITIVDGYLNKTKIGSKPPSVYMTKFKNENNNLNKTMESHLISNLESFGIWDDDFNTFFKERANIVSKMLNDKIITQFTNQDAQISIG